MRVIFCHDVLRENVTNKAELLLTNAANAAKVLRQRVLRVHVILFLFVVHSGHVVFFVAAQILDFSAKRLDSGRQF